MNSHDVELFLNLYQIYPNPEFGVTAPSVKGKPIFETKIWSVDLAEECLFEDFSNSCKGQSVYIIVTDGNLGGKAYGLVLEKAFEWQVLELNYRETDTPCVAIKILERKAKKIAQNMSWVTKEHVICISPNGIVPI